MGRTKLAVSDGLFYINGRPIYSELPNCPERYHGLLMNSRMIQGVFDDRDHREQYTRGGLPPFEPQAHTQALIDSLEEWYGYGLRAITVGFQGGWPVGMRDVEEIDNNPFGPDGERLDPVYLARMDRLIQAADTLGLVVIVNVFYWAQAKKMRSGQALTAALTNVCRHLREKNYTNIILDVANEHDLDGFDTHPLIQSGEGMAQLIRLAREESGLPVGCSGSGGHIDPEVCRASDVVFIHGNGLSRGQYYDFIQKVKALAGGRPIVCNEDSPCLSRLDVALETGTSWGYYNNYTKQIPPALWGVTQGEDLYFARRMAARLGIPLPPLEPGEEFTLQGLQPQEQVGGGLRTVRLAAQEPEKVDRVDFYKNGQKLYTSYDEPFFLYTQTSWLGTPQKLRPGDRFAARIHLTDGTVKEKEAEVR